MSDTVIVQIVTAVISLIGACFTAYIGLLMARIKTGQAAAAVEVQTVKETLKTAEASKAVRAQEVKQAAAVTDSKLDSIVATGAAVHALVNGARSTLLKATADALCRVAELTAGRPSHPSDLAAAQAAVAAYQDHEQRQQAAGQS